MDVLLYKLRFTGAVHFGDTGVDLENVQEIIHSDTIFSALINVINIYYGIKEAGDWIERFINDPPFLLSSLFVYYKDSYFLPKPLDDSSVPDEIKVEKGKVLKGLKWLEREDFLKWKKLTPEDLEIIEKNKSKYKEAFVKEIRPRVTLDRITQQSSIYHCGYIYFRKDAGLYGLVAFRDSSLVEKFKRLLLLLGQTGLGGERTYGCGRFEVTFDEKLDEAFRSILQEDSDRYVLLSLYHPAENERENLVSSLLSYDIVRKKGWITSGRYALPLKRKSVGFITEGSVVKAPVKGCLVNVTPEYAPSDTLSHSVYRYGYAFTVPLKEA